MHLPAVLPKVEDAFKAHCYVPYTALSLASRMKAAHGDESFIINSSGSLTVKGLDRSHERSISVIDWQAASRTAEERIRAHFGDVRANALAAHHAIVMNIARLHNWAITVEYDVSQRELASLNPTHDLSSMDATTLTIIATRPTAPVPAGYSAGASSPLKRGAPSEAALCSPRKRMCSHCFQCG